MVFTAIKRENRQENTHGFLRVTCLTIHVTISHQEKVMNGIIIDGKVYEAVQGNCSDCDVKSMCDRKLDCYDADLCHMLSIWGTHNFRMNQSLTDKLKSTDMKKIDLYVHGNIICQDNLTFNGSLGAISICAHTPAENCDLDNAIVIHGDLIVSGMTVNARSIACSGSIASR